MAYSWQTLAGAQADLAARLYDAGQQWWGPGELTIRIIDVLRMWNALTSFWRSDMSLTVGLTTVWYDISAATGSPRPMTVTDNDLLQSIEYSLVEPPTAAYPLVWTGTVHEQNRPARQYLCPGQRPHRLHTRRFATIP